MGNWAELFDDILFELYDEAGIRAPARTPLEERSNRSYLFLLYIQVRQLSQSPGIEEQTVIDITQNGQTYNTVRTRFEEVYTHEAVTRFLLLLIARASEP